MDECLKKFVHQVVKFVCVSTQYQYWSVDISWQNAGKTQAVVLDIALGLLSGPHGN